ncbi:MAG: DUF6069 family protein [Roseiflexaceae bacterium]|nr:DUF6069 family protein [Roseiflexus sp.]MDW8212586.1 DUF6069 family protein [Roseiflexaceae bacterium]
MATIAQTRLSNATLLKAGSAAVAAAVVANVVTRLILGAIVPLSPDFMPFMLGPIVTFTLLFTLIGVGVLAIVNRVAANPLRTYNTIGVIAFFVSLIPNLAGAANPSAMPMGGTGTDYLILIIFHVVAAVAFLGVLNVLARRA